MNAPVKAIVGALVCLGFAIMRVPTVADEAWTHALLLFAALVLMPLMLELLVELNDAPQVKRWFGWLMVGQLPAGILLAAAYFMAPGVAAAGLALPWVAFTAMAAAIGITRALRQGWSRPLGRLCADVAMVYLVVGGLWTLADRMGFAPLHFLPAIVALTAVHFHFAGFLLPVFAGFVVRRHPESRGVARVAVGAVLGVPAVAVGITATQLGAGPGVEAAAGTALALAGLALGVLHVRIGWDGAMPTVARVLLALSGASLFFAMILAGLYAMRFFAAPVAGLGLPQMRWLHGTMNALGFGLCGVLGWRAAATRPTPRGTG